MVSKRNNMIEKIGSFVRKSVSLVDLQGHDLGKPPAEYFQAVASQLFVLPEWLTLLVINSDLHFKIIQEDTKAEIDRERAEFNAESGVLGIKSNSLLSVGINSIFLHEICHATDWILQQYSRDSADSESPRREGTTFFSLMDQKWNDAMKHDLFDGKTFKALTVQQRLDTLNAEDKIEKLADLFEKNEPLIELTKHLAPNFETCKKKNPKGYESFRYPREAFAEIMTYWLDGHYEHDAIRASFPAMSQIMEKEILPELERISHEIGALDKVNNELPLPWINREGATIVRERGEAQQAHLTR